MFGLQILRCTSTHNVAAVKSGRISYLISYIGLPAKAPTTLSNSKTRWDYPVLCAVATLPSLEISSLKDMCPKRHSLVFLLIHPLGLKGWLYQECPLAHREWNIQPEKTHMTCCGLTSKARHRSSNTLTEALVAKQISKALQELFPRTLNYR